ncbi:hypothetical protein PsorP6_001631 [Peronosclerospora sorghi]|uniref:Uncharacterized protein n=1 Tax=Peronosclerospora sorghi TaxID=230839 RepID=A0ACC0WQ07_9STRA|nr:hypothetical protein PsorP6_001631 [Peronosclerospora sorghi]
MLKKEKLEQMRELGRGGLSKGLQFLRTAATTASLENGDAATASATGTTDGNVDEGTVPSRMTYDELLALSMKLTRQNKLLKVQYQKHQTQLARAATSDAERHVLRRFLETEVGLDVAACTRSAGGRTDAPGGSIDLDVLKAKYRTLTSVARTQGPMAARPRASMDDERSEGSDASQEVDAAATAVHDEETKQDVRPPLPMELEAATNDPARLEDARRETEEESGRTHPEEPGRTHTEEENGRTQVSADKEHVVAATHDEQQVGAHEPAAASSSSEALVEELVALRHEVDALKHEKRALEDVNRELRAHHDRADAARATLDMQLAEERAYWTHKLEALITDKDAAQTHIAALETAVREKETLVTTLTADVTALQDQVHTLQDDLARAGTSLKEQATQAEATTQRVLTTEHELATLRQAHALQRTQLDALEAAQSAKTREVAHVSAELAETKKTLSDRMALATRLQTENMRLAAQVADQVALVESAVREAAAARTAQDELAHEVARAHADVERMQQRATHLTEQLAQAEETMRAHDARVQVERDHAHDAIDAAKQHAQHELAQHVARLEAESKHKSKLALQAVLEKDDELARLRTRLQQVEDDVRSGGADHRQILELAQLQATRDAEARQQAAQLEALRQQVTHAQHEMHALREANEQQAHELQALLQNQRRDGVNMEYLKNVVVQYLAFPPGSSQQARLVPVLATLLQFTAADQHEIQRACGRRATSWTAWRSRDVERHAPAPRASSVYVSHESAANPFAESAEF